MIANCLALFFMSVNVSINSSALSVAIRANRIYSTNMESPAKEVMFVMAKRLFSYVPILDAADKSAKVLEQLCAVLGVTYLGVKLDTPQVFVLCSSDRGVLCPSEQANRSCLHHITVALQNS